MHPYPVSVNVNGRSHVKSRDRTAARVTVRLASIILNLPSLAIMLFSDAKKYCYYSGA